MHILVYIYISIYLHIYIYIYINICLYTLYIYDVNNLFLFQSIEFDATYRFWVEHMHELGWVARWKKVVANPTGWVWVGQVNEPCDD